MERLSWLLYFRLRGIEAAMTEHCDGEMIMCQDFTSLTSTEINPYYQALEFQTLRYSGNFTLRGPVSFENRVNSYRYNNIFQVKVTENGSLINVKVKLY